MMEQNVVAVIGPGSSSDVRATHPICAGLHIPQIAPLATDPNLIKLDHPFLARVCVIVHKTKNCLKLN